ncbi:MarR family transcriptional regulator [Sphingomonas aliaeris]|uniref:MarR family transcriptional regulator n=1 Tax=Sphingomonas aliaeris TaxID=2759526 RepID=A0A974NVI3_9SPHN|nr:MarR family transcriptional regulator [Sphingomonas aliaeris]QQV77672.1 MarR family transcriptional regulator [Sphingomonas aliaeris]
MARQSSERANMDTKVTLSVEDGEAEPVRRPSAKQFRFGYLIHDVSRLRRIIMDDIMRPYGITRSQWAMLSALSRSGNMGMTQVDLARLLEIGKVTAGGLLERMETTGHIERRADSSDGRARRVFITEQGYETIRLMIAVASKANKRIMRGVSAEEAKIAEKVMFKIKLNLKDIHEEAALNGKTEEFGSLLKSAEDDL